MSSVANLVFRLILSFLLSVNAAWIYSTRVEVPNLSARIALETAIVEHRAPSPYSFRILVPEVAHFLQKSLIDAGLSQLQAHRLTYLSINTLCILVLLLGAIKLGRFESISEVAICAFLIYAGLNVALFDHAYQPWTLVEASLIVAAVLALSHHKYLIVGIAPLATLNRETGLLLVPSILLYLAIQGGAHLRRTWFSVVVAGFLSVVVEILLRKNIPYSGQEIGLPEIINLNLQGSSILLAVFNFTLMFGCTCVLYLFSGQAKIHRLAASLGWLAPFLFAISIFGVWYEVRLLILMLPFASVLATSSLRKNTLP